MKFFTTKLSGEKSKKIISFKVYLSQILITQNFMLILMQKTVFDFNIF